MVNTVKPYGHHASFASVAMIYCPMGRETLVEKSNGDRPEAQPPADRRVDSRSL
jgi:hypothetical protein